MVCWEYVPQASFMQRIGLTFVVLVMLSAMLTFFHYRQRSADVSVTSEELGCSESAAIEVDSQACTSGFDFSLVTVDVKWDPRDVFESSRCVVQLFYGSMVVAEWHGSSENGEKNGVFAADLSADKATLTLASPEGHLSIRVSELVEGRLLGAGCPEPPRNPQQRSRPCRKKFNAKHIIEEHGCSESVAVEANSVPTKSSESTPLVAIPKGAEELDVADLPSPCRRRRLEQGPLLVA
jgi:hypothetical protein